MYCPTYGIIFFITLFISFVIQSVHFIPFTVFFTFAFYINIVVVIIDSIIGVVTAIISISRDRLVIDLCKKELYFVIYKGLEDLENCDVICCLVSICQVKVQLGISFLDSSKQDNLYELVYDI